MGARTSKPASLQTTHPEQDPSRQNCDQPKGKPMPFVTVGHENSGAIDLHYEDSGKGRPIILIHGYPLSGRAWEKQVPALLNAGFRVITYDRRGFGQSSQPASGYNYDVFADDLRKLITKLSLHGYALAGHSMGGGEVARYLGKYGSEGVTAAIFIGGVPPYLFKAADNPEGIDRSVFEEIKKQVAADRPAYLKSFCAEFYNYDVLGGKLVSEEAMQASWNIAVGCSPKAALDCVDAWGTDFREDLKRIDIPALVIHGDQDRIVPFARSGKRVPEFVHNCQTSVVQGAPHGLAWTHADQVNRQLLEFLGKAQPSSKAA
jgi:non-heme chloroperoxidase